MINNEVDKYNRLVDEYNSRGIGEPLRKLKYEDDKPQPEWDEVVEDEFTFITGVELKNYSILRILRRYGCYDNPVRIKCRKGCIQIERCK